MIIEIAKELILKTLKMIDENLKAICSLVYLFFVIISILYCNDENRFTYLWVMILIFVAFSLVCIFDTKINEKERKDKMPKERYTKKNENGDISIEESKLNQAMIFLSLLEDDLYGN